MQLLSITKQQRRFVLCHRFHLASDSSIPAYLEAYCLPYDDDSLLSTYGTLDYNNSLQDGFVFVEVDGTKLVSSETSSRNISSGTNHVLKVAVSNIQKWRGIRLATVLFGFDGGRQWRARHDDEEDPDDDEENDEIPDYVVSDISLKMDNQNFQKCSLSNQKWPKTYSYFDFGYRTDISWTLKIPFYFTGLDFNVTVETINNKEERKHFVSTFVFDVGPNDDVITGVGLKQSVGEKLDWLLVHKPILWGLLSGCGFGVLVCLCISCALLRRRRREVEVEHVQPEFGNAEYYIEEYRISPQTKGRYMPRIT